MFVAVNAVAFYLLRPGVPDLWAARARAFATGHGVGLTYWFSWFGGTTPGGYSMITPYLCAVLGTELVVGLAAVVSGALVAVLVRDTRRPALAGWMAALGIVANLWCGRVPFLVGSAFALAALVLVQRRRRTAVVLLSVLAACASPVSGAFLCVGLSGALLAAGTRSYRPAILLSILSTAGTLVAIAALFGDPGVEPFPAYLIGEVAAALVLMLIATPHGHLRQTLAVSAVAAVVVFCIPNGMGANLVRLALFCLPPAAVALSRRRARTLAVLMLPIVVFGALSSVSALRSAIRPGSTARYYTSLADELDALHGAPNQRLEIVNGAHAAYAVLLGHAQLARGWETQDDLRLNAVLDSSTLDAARYRTWLDDNAVGLVAVSGRSTASPETRVVNRVRPQYLHRVWHSASWTLYAVQDPTPIVARPARLEAASESSMTVRVPCACTTSLRIRWSAFLEVTPQRARGAVAASYRPTLAEDGFGWTLLTTDRAGIYVLDGSA